MSYQIVKTPRFYIDHINYERATGQTSAADQILNGIDNDDLRMAGLNPNPPMVRLYPSETGDHAIYRFPIVSQKHNWCGIIGHDMGTANTFFYPRYYDRTIDQSIACRNAIALVNGGYELELYENTVDGFSLWVNENEGDYFLKGSEEEPYTNPITHFSFIFHPTNEVNGVHTWETDALTIGSLCVGTYYDMPQAADLEVKMSIEMGGVKNRKTQGGASLATINYIKPPDWGDMGAWQLGTDDDGNPLSNLRNGRRVWDLSFSFLSDSDVMPNLGVQNYEDGVTTEDIITGTDFFSVVWNRTLGGHLPFIFQPDSTNFFSDQFAICRFDMKSLKITQTMHRKYNVTLKIRESW